MHGLGNNLSNIKTISKPRICLLFTLVSSLIFVTTFEEYLSNTHWFNNARVNRRTSVKKGNRISPKIPNVFTYDRIYNPYNGPIVIPEYKLIFLTIPKVACSEWKRMFLRMNHNPKWCASHYSVHTFNDNHYKRLHHYPPKQARFMMTSPEWTRAVFVREPKERILSAFLDKAVKETYFVQHCCNKIQDKEEAKKCRYCHNFPEESIERKECVNDPKNFANFLHFITKYPQQCRDVHWEPQKYKLDKKWWPYMNFIGHKSNIQDDAKRLLQTIVSDTDKVEGQGRTAWDRYGVSGWGTSGQCEKRTGSFLQFNSSTHNIDSARRMTMFYTPELEKFVEEHWYMDWQIDGVHFPRVKLFESIEGIIPEIA